MSPSWKRDPGTGEWIQVERTATLGREWAPGPNAGWRRTGAGDQRRRAPLLWWLVVAIPAAAAIIVVVVLTAGKGFDYGR